MLGGCCGERGGDCGGYSRDLLGLPAEETKIALVRGSAAVPEKQPLVGLARLELVLEAEVVVGVVVANEVEKDGRGLKDGEGGGLVVVD